MEQLHILTLSLMAQRTTWETPTPPKVGQEPVCRDQTPPATQPSVLTGAYYNIIRVPGGKPVEGETLEGASVLCSIRSSEKTKPSYYHSFGECLSFSY